MGAGSRDIRSVTVAAALCLLAASCSQGGDFCEFHDTDPGNGGICCFNVPFSGSGAVYETFIACRFNSLPEGTVSIPLILTAVSPSGKIAQETLSLPLDGERTGSFEWPYRSNVSPAQDTGVWYVSLVVPSAALSQQLLGMGFRSRRCDMDKSIAKDEFEE